MDGRAGQKGIYIVDVYVRRETKGRNNTGDGKECQEGETAEGRVLEKGYREWSEGKAQGRDKKRKRDLNEVFESEYMKTNNFIVF